MKKFILFLMFIPVMVLSSCLKSDPPFDSVAQSKTDDQLIQTYLAAHPDIHATKDTTGLYYQVIDPGSGTHPNAKSTVTLDINVDLLNGLNVGINQGYVSVVSNLIFGWQTGLPQIASGGTILLIVPSGLAYGPFQSGNIPPNSVLVSTLKLTDIKN